MQYQSFRITNRLVSNKGAVIPLFAVTITVALIFAALALDLGDTMRRQALLNATLDTATLRGVERLRLRIGGVNNAFLEGKTVARQITEANLKATGITGNSLQTIMDNLIITSPEEATIRAESKVSHDNWFSHFLNSTETQLFAPAISEARVDRTGAGNPPACNFVGIIVNISESINYTGPGGGSRRDLMVESIEQMTSEMPDNTDVMVLAYHSNMNPGLTYGPVSFLNFSERAGVVNWVRNAGAGPDLRDTAQALNESMSIIQSRTTCPNISAILYTDGMPNKNSATTDLYACDPVGGPLLDEAKGNSIKWADAFREQVGPLHVFGVGVGDIAGSYETDFLRRLAGRSEYNNLACPRPLSALPAGTNNAEYYTGLDSVESKMAGEAIMGQIGRYVGEAVTTLRLME